MSALRRAETEREQAIRLAEAIERYWHRAGHSSIKAWVVDEPIGDGVGRHWAIKTNLRNGAPPA
jgi:hypothetical protein